MFYDHTMFYGQESAITFHVRQDEGRVQGAKPLGKARRAEGAPTSPTCGHGICLPGISIPGRPQVIIKHKPADVRL